VLNEVDYEGALMADLQTIISQPGPLPIKVAATIETDLPAAVLVAGSVWSVDQEFMIGISLSIDGSQVATAQIFANPAATHLAVVPVMFSYTFTIGEHVFELDALTGETTSDQNDFFQVSLLY
jgi:hypothetical protein